MMSLLKYQNGYVKIKVTGKFLERFINLCLAHNIDIWSLRYNNNAIILYTTIAGFKSIRPILKTCKCSVKILKKKGLPFLMDNMLRHKYLFSCLVFLVVLGIWGSMYIWFIDVNAPYGFNEVEIREILADSGLKKGVFRSKVDHLILTRNIRTKYPNIRWVNLELKGIKAKVNILLRAENSDGKIHSGDIVATRDGYIDELIVLDGTALVKVGEIVTKGQVVIEGRVYNKEEFLHEVPARGIIKTVTWYYGNGLASSKYTELVSTGNKKVEFLWKFKDKEGHIYGERNDFELYKFYEYRYPIKWGNLVSSVEIVKRVYLEQKATIVSLTKEQVKKRAENEALVSALTQIGPICSPIEIKYKYVDLQNMLYAEATIKAHEIITEFRYHHR